MHTTPSTISETLVCCGCRATTTFTGRRETYHLLVRPLGNSLNMESAMKNLVQFVITLKGRSCAQYRKFEGQHCLMNKNGTGGLGVMFLMQPLRGEIPRNPTRDVGL